MIQQGCVFFDRGGITIGDNVQIGPKVNLVTLNHDLSIGGNRKATYCKPIVIEDFQLEIIWAFDTRSRAMITSISGF